MNKETSLCGFNCIICPAFKSNIKSEDDRLKVDEGWKRFHRTRGWIYEEDYCQGCFNVSKAPLWSSCYIRKCVLTNNVENCGYCPDYPCPRIKNMIHITKKIAERTKKEGTQADYQKFGLPYLNESKLEELHQEYTKTVRDTGTPPLNIPTVKFPQNVTQELISRQQIRKLELLQDLHSCLESMLTLHCKTPGGQEQELKKNKELLKFLWIIGRYGSLITDTDKSSIEITPKKIKKHLKYGKWRTERKLQELATHGIDGHYSSDKVGIKFTKNYEIAILLQKYIQILLENNSERIAYSKFWKADMNVFGG
ncbi:MAG: DUF3795 domain-containing protein [Candidatus Hodarchaeota archaeon]